MGCQGFKYILYCHPHADIYRMQNRRTPRPQERKCEPISEKVYPFFEYWYNLNDCEYLLSTPEGEHFKYRNYYDSYWSPLIETLGMKHRPHDTRHTCISMLTVAGVSDKVIKKIVGHKGQGVTEVVYTHFEIEELIDAINKI